MTLNPKHTLSKPRNELKAQSKEQKENRERLIRLKGSAFDTLRPSKHNNSSKFSPKKGDKFDEQKQSENR